VVEFVGERRAEATVGESGSSTGRARPPLADDGAARHPQGSRSCASPRSAGRSGGVNISGSVSSVDGDIVGRDKIIGIPPDQLPAIIKAATSDWKRLTDKQRKIITKLESKLGVSTGALRAFFRTLGEAEVPPERQEGKLVEIAEHYKQLVAQVAAAPGDDPEVAKLKGEAKAALDAGQLERADDLLAQVQAAQDAAKLH
jgi:hypothetical protein